MTLKPTKTIEQNFIDWESGVFGFGYGSGETHILKALQLFLSNVGKGEVNYPSTYDYRYLESVPALGPAPTWFLINALCRANIIEYGTSPRFGWLTKEGESLKKFVCSKTVDELYDLVCNVTQDDTICSPQSCNCGEHGYEKGRVCYNPFWRNHHD